jgi:Protein of unknown function (DUF2817)
MLNSYPATYQEARNGFRDAALHIDAQLEEHIVISYPEYGGDLTIDVALAGATQPAWSLVVSSGLHGVEGFFGSAIQTAYLRNYFDGSLKEFGGQLVFIHSLNPYGFSALRRVNEDNVDLNRNFLLPGEPYGGASRAYAQLNDFLNPAAVPQRVNTYLPQVLWEIYRVGLPALKQAVAEGQYEYPNGIFFGGHKTARSTEIVQKKYDEMGSSQKGNSFGLSQWIRQIRPL